jgi:hypothetical protein
MHDSKNNLSKYAGLGAQLFLTMLIALFIGMKTDSWIGFEMPLLIWILPLLVILGTLVKIIIETNKKKP